MRSRYWHLLDRMACTEMKWGALAERLEAGKMDKSPGISAPPHGNKPNPQEINTLVSLFNQGRFNEAMPLAQQMTVRFPVDGLGWKALGFALQQMGRFAEAIEPLQKAVALLPDDAEAQKTWASPCKICGD